MTCDMWEGLLSFLRVLSAPTFPWPPLLLLLLLSSSASVRGAEHLRGKLRCVSMHLFQHGGPMAKPGSSLLCGFAGMAIKTEWRYRMAGGAHSGTPQSAMVTEIGQRDDRGWGGEWTRRPLLGVWYSSPHAGWVRHCSSVIAIM